MKMKRFEDDFTFSFAQEENPDWAYARNRQFVLKRTDACWSSSLFSVNLGEFITPNRDYPQQGLLFRTGGDYMKFLDTVMFKLMHEGEVVELEKEGVEVTPWRATYTYSSEEADLEVTYYLSKSTLKNRAGGWIEFELSSSYDEMDLIVSPVVDIRKIGGQSPSMGEYDIDSKRDVLHVSKDGKEVIFGPCDKAMVQTEEEKWEYKLGDGFRERTDEGIKFRAVEKRPVKAGLMTYEISGEDKVKMAVACGEDLDRTDLQFFKETNFRKDKEEAKKILDGFKFPKDGKQKRFLENRLLALGKFSIREGGMEIPEAGEWWFKDVWFRDLFESLFHEMEFYREVKGDGWIKKLLIWARIYLEDGVMAAKADDKDPVYNSIDASLLYLLCAAKYYEKTGDENFKENMKKTFDSVVESLGEQDGLVRCRPEYSWLDSVVDGEATRTPDNWDVEEEDRFLLPEVNALWIRVLEEYNKIYDADKDLRKAWSSFKEMFWDEKRSFIYHIVYDGNEVLKDETESSVAVVSLALLKDYFFGYELLEAWKVVKEKLLIGRRPVFFDENYIPFGILTKNSNEDVYLGDEEYHEAVVWPRDNPYLFKILEKIGRENIKEDIMKNMLDHQMSEGAIFYNQELFSLPEGEDPCETSQSSNPVPVKNPVQLWSHFLPDLQVSKD
ncbi:MAG: amylo-alpha-1,6-glucosidase [Candidatus Aenigmatarchaeota archaeon]